MTTTEGTTRTLSGNSYQAEILRHVHEVYGGHLQDTDIGVTRRLWNELGQTAGCHFASVSAALSALETDGRLITEFGIRTQGGRCRTSVLVVEEPPEGFTVFKGRLLRRSHDEPDVTDGKPPTAEEIANWLLKKTVEASQVPVFDLVAAQHHVECLTEDLMAWQELATEYEERIITMRAHLDDLLTAPPAVIAADTPVEDPQIHQLERELVQMTRWRDSARDDLKRLRQLLSQAQVRVTELTQENADLHGRLGSALEEEEARQLRQRVYGLERSLTESRDANQKAERKITQQAEKLREARATMDDGERVIRQAHAEMASARAQRDRYKEQCRVYAQQLTAATERLIEYMFPNDEPQMSDAKRIWVDAITDVARDLYADPEQLNVPSVRERLRVIGDLAVEAEMDALIISTDNDTYARLGLRSNDININDI